MSEPVGALGLSFGNVGGVAQAIGACLVDRGHQKALIVERLLSTDFFDESLWWERYGGRIVDDFAEFIEVEPYPTEGDE